MSQYGFSYGASEGYYPSQAGGSHPFPSYNAASSQIRPEETSQHAYDYNRSVIPGLGLGFSQPQATPPGLTGQAYQPVAAPAVPPQSDLQGDQGSTYHVPTIENEIDEGAVGDNELEEGELSEGELEDIYEPQSLPPKPPHSANGNTYDSGPATSFLNNEPSTANPPSRYPSGEHDSAPGSLFLMLTFSALDQNGAYVPYVPPPDNPLPKPRTFDGENTLPRACLFDFIAIT